MYWLVFPQIVRMQEEVKEGLMMRIGNGDERGG
jgi:hypothetical protein